MVHYSSNIFRHLMKENLVLMFKYSLGTSSTYLSFDKFYFFYNKFIVPLNISFKKKTKVAQSLFKHLNETRGGIQGLY